MTSFRMTLVALAVAGLMLQGCVAAMFGAGAGAGTYAYVRGEYQTTVPKPLGKTYTATVAALKDLEMPVTDSSKDLTDGTVTARKGDGSEVKVFLKAEGDKVTSVKIRIGIFGDEAASKVIAAKISSRLGE